MARQRAAVPTPLAAAAKIAAERRQTGFNLDSRQGDTPTGALYDAPQRTTNPLAARL
jgi:hypothetical protein